MQTTVFFPMRSAAGALIALTAVFGGPVTAGAQAGSERISDHRDWGAFTAEVGGVRSCFAATDPTDQDFSQSVTSRGEPFLVVSTFPSEEVRDEVSVMLGFEADPDEPLTLTVDGGDPYDLFGDGTVAYLANGVDNATVVGALRRGRQAVVRSTSAGRGTRVTDTYSLFGFTAALNDANERCE